MLVALVLVVLGAGAAFFLLGNDDRDDGATTGGDGASAAAPDEVARSFVEAARNQDCETTTTEELDLVQEDGAWKVDLAAGEATASASSAGG